MQIDSPRPWFLKQRIMGGSGHLSNEQAFDAVRTILNQCDARGRPIRPTSCCCTGAATATARTACGGSSGATRGSRRASC
jgi:hypothetical protein